MAGTVERTRRAMTIGDDGREFDVWRKRERRKRLCVRVGVAGAALALCFLIVTLRRDQPAPAAASDPPPYSPVKALAVAPRPALSEAMADAVGRLPWKEPKTFLGPWEIKSARQREAAGGQRYRLLLAAGYRITFGASCRRTSVAFAAALGDDYREEWLRDSFETVGTERGYNELWKHLGTLNSELKYAFLYSRSQREDRLEAIFNLSSDANLRLSASRAWDQIERARYSVALADWEEIRRTPRHLIAAYPARATLGTIPIWDFDDLSRPPPASEVCLVCDGVGTLRCHGCGGTLKAKCPACNAVKKSQRCATCGGRGRYGKCRECIGGRSGCPECG